MEVCSGREEILDDVCYTYVVLIGWKMLTICGGLGGLYVSCL